MSPLLWTLLVALTGADPGAVPKPSAVPAGIVVEKVLPGFEAAKAGIQAGDVLISWERGANPPANPSGASGSFRSPFDVTEVFIEQSPRARMMTLGVLRAGKRIVIPVRQFPWELETRPLFSPRWIGRYEEGRRLIEIGETEKGWGAWESLAVSLSKAGHHVDAAWLGSRVGAGESGAKQTDRALTSLGAALLEARAAVRPDIEAQLLVRKSDFLYEGRRIAEGRKAALAALAIRERTAPETLAIVDALRSVWMVTDDPEFGSFVGRALLLAGRLAPASLIEASTLSEMAAFAEHHGDAGTALEYVRRALAIHRALDPDGLTVAFSFNDLCVTQASRGDLASADESCRQSLSIRRRVEPQAGKAVAIGFHNMAWIAGLRGDLDRARDLYLQALAIRERVEPVSPGMGWNLYELGVTELRRGNLEGAEDYFGRAEKIQGAVAEPYSPYRAESAARRAEVAYRRGDLVDAERLLRESIAFYEPYNPNGPRAAQALDWLGRVLVEQAQWKEAESRIRRALELRRGFAPGSRDTADSNHSLGMLLWKTGRPDEAESSLRAAVDDLESQRAKLGGSEESWSVFAAAFADYYKDYARLLMELRREQDAFLILERFRAGAFLRILAQRDLAAPPEISGDLDRDRRLANAEYDRTQSEIRGLNAKEDASKIDEGLTHLVELRLRQSEIAERIKKASPKYGALQYPQPLGLTGTVAILDPGTLLLSYSIGKEKSFLFAVSSDGKRGPPLSVFALPVGEKALRASVEAMRRLIEWNKPSPDLLARSRALYETLLKPAEALIARSDRLLIVPDGPLNTLPWASLVRESNGAETRYLIEWKPVHTVVSATVYAELKKERREGARSGAVELAAFGDPRYPVLPGSKPSVERGDGTEEAPEEPYGEPEIDAVTRGGYRFQALPRSRQEVETIASLYAPNSETFLGELATEERAKSIGKDVSLIHYACHAYVNERFPLDSALVFTIPDKPKEGQANGLLQAWEIFEKVRIDADLVTLSACDSGLGKEMGGEGLIGLTRAFQYAGARTVLASLWKVDDASTAELMKRFYGYLKAGRTKDEALRLAQVELIRSTRYSQPRDWAAFELMGDWK